MEGFTLTINNGVQLADMCIQAVLTIDQDNNPYPTGSVRHGIEMAICEGDDASRGVVPISREVNPLRPKQYIDIHRAVKTLLQKAKITPPWEDVKAGKKESVVWTCGITFRVLYGRTWMENGNLHSDIEEGRANSAGPYMAIHGSISEKRLMKGWTMPETFTATSKPSGNEEIVFPESRNMHTVYEGTQATTYLWSNPKEGNSLTKGGATYYAEDCNDLYTFLFKNRFGAPEMVQVKCKPVVKYSADIKTYTRTRPVSQPLSRDSLHLAEKGNKVWEMSSGAVSQAYAEWFVTDFLNGKKHYLLVDGVWEAVEVKADGELSIRNYGKAEACEVKFTMKRALAGSTVNKPSSVDTDYTGDTKRLYVIEFKTPFGNTDSVRLECLPTLSATTSGATYKRGEHANNDVDMTHVAKPVHRMWKMSTGPISEAQAEWYASQFLCGSDHYMTVDGQKIPVTISGGDSKIRDYGKAEACKVEFNVTEAVRE